MTDQEDRLTDRPIRLVDLAAELGYSSASIRKVVRRRGFEPFQLQKGPNKPYYLSRDDARALREKLEDEKNYRIAQEVRIAPSGLSGIYAVEVPSYDGTVRVKIGWSDNIPDRLDTYRTIIPDLRVSRIWPCPNKWSEQMALKWAENNAKRVGQEIFEFRDKLASLAALDELFLSLGIKPKSQGS